MLPFPSPNETMNRELEGLEQRDIEDDVREDEQDRLDPRPETKEGAETQSASDETLEDKGA